MGRTYGGLIYGKYGYKNAFASLRFAFFGNRRRIFRTTGEKNRKIRFACHIRSVCCPLPCGNNPFRTFADIQMKKSRGLTKAAAFFSPSSIILSQSSARRKTKGSFRPKNSVRLSFRCLRNIAVNISNGAVADSFPFALNAKVF